MTEASHADAGLLYVVSGALQLSRIAGDEANENNANNGDHEDQQTTLYVAHEGECVGQLCLLTGEANFYSCLALSPSAFVERSASSSRLSSTVEVQPRRSRHTTEEPAIVAVLTRDTIDEVLERWPEAVRRKNCYINHYFTILKVICSLIYV